MKCRVSWPKARIGGSGLPVKAPQRTITFAILSILISLVVTAPGGAQALTRSLLPERRVAAGAWDYDTLLGPDRVTAPQDAIHVVVHDAHSLQQALAAAAPGQVIELADGEYDVGEPFRIHGVRGREAAPLIVRAQNQGKAVIAGDSWFMVQDSSYIVIEGLTFVTDDDTRSHAVRLQSTDHSRVTRNHFALTESPANFTSRHWVYIAGTGADYNRIDHNLFERKRRIGNFVSINGDDVQVAQHTRVDRNHFRDVRSVNHNGMEAIRIGSSVVTRSHAFTVIEHNLFEQCSGEVEIITVKSGGNHIRYNTFLESEGALTFRHGNDNHAYGNFFIGNNKPNTGGIRVYGRGHFIYNNHFEGLEGIGATSALVLGSADNGYQEKVLDYWQVDRVLVAFNTFVNNRSAIEIGWGWGQDRPFTPKNTLIANNLIFSESPGTLLSAGPPADITWTGNIVYARGGAQLGHAQEIQGARVLDPLLRDQAWGAHVPAAGAPGIDSARETALFEVVRVDIEGKPRDDHPDVGAFEYRGYPLLRGPLVASEVGPNAADAQPFSLDEPGVHITELSLSGVNDDGRGWRGPAGVVLKYVTTGGVPPDATLRLLIDDVKVYQGDADLSVPVVINQGELEDGRHTLSAAVETAGTRDERTLQFSVANVGFKSPAPERYVQGDLRIEPFVGYPSETLHSLRITLDDRTLYQGATASGELVVDTLQLNDGPHRLAAFARSLEGVTARHEIVVNVDNYWEKSDSLQPPVDWGLLGVMERLLTSSKSDGWRHETSSPELFFDDGDRMTPGGTGPQYLVWEAPNLTNAVITLYARSGNITERVQLDVLRNGSDWEGLEFEVRESVKANGAAEQDWQRLTLVADVIESAGASHFRFTIRTDDLAADEMPRVGHVELRGLH